MDAVPATTKPTSRRLRLATAIAMASIATLAPLVASMYAAHLSLVRTEKEHLQQFAERAVLRLDLVMSQASTAIGDIERATGEKCSPDYLEQLRRITFRYQYVGDAGLIAGGGIPVHIATW